jgi:hypothetical protein
MQPEPQHPPHAYVEQTDSLKVVACSLCLRVLHESGWVDAGQLIRERRTFDLPSPVHLESGICDGCIDRIAERRMAQSPQRSREAA